MLRSNFTAIVYPGLLAIMHCVAEKYVAVPLKHRAAGVGSSEAFSSGSRS